MEEVFASLPSSETVTRPLARAEHVSMVLRVGLRFSDQDSEVHFDLTPRATAPEGEHRIWRCPFGTLGAPSNLLQPPQNFSLPVQLVGGLREALTAESLPVDQPLWLDLIRPYGLLGVLPWEAALGNALGRPILRLPSFIEPVHEGEDIADLALLLCATPTYDRDRMVWQVRSVADAVLQASGRLQTRVHIFASKPWYDVFLSESLDHERISLYHPPSRSRATQRGPRDLRRLWTDWISVSLGGQTVDAVHIICDAVPTSVGAMLSLEQPWGISGRRIVARASVEDMCAMLTRLGAWTAIITPAALSASKQAAAFFADATAHTRPGPLLYHLLEDQKDAQALIDAYRFLLSPRPTHSPRLSHGFLYCPSSAVAHEVPISADEIAAAIEPAAPSTKEIAVSPHPRVPNWASATQRFFETAKLDELRRASGDVLLSRAGSMPDKVDPAALTKDVKVANQTLSDILGVISQHLSAGTSAGVKRQYGARSGGRNSSTGGTAVTPREAVIEIASFDVGKLGVRLWKSTASYPDATRFKSISLDRSGLPKLDTQENVERYATLIRNALCSHNAIAAELNQIATTTTAAQLRFLVGVPDAEALRWEAVSLRPNTFLALKPNCAVTRIAHASDIRDPGLRTFSFPLRMMAFLSPATISARDEFEAIIDQVLAARKKGLEIICSIYLGEQDLLEKQLERIRAGELPGIEVASMPSTGLQIEHFIRNKPPQLLHFFCHGKTDAGEQLLEFATINDWDLEQDTGSVKLTMERLRQTLISTGTTWATVLNSCSGARAVEKLQSAVEQLHSMALALAQNASPVAIGMAEPIDAADATIFARAFYGGLFDILDTSLAGVAQGDEVVLDLAPAICDARAALRETFRSHPALPEEAFGRWCLPLLYERDTPLTVMRISDEIKPRIELAQARRSRTSTPGASSAAPTRSSSKRSAPRKSQKSRARRRAGFPSW